jgi:nucleoside-diphosphate-sugar epimerase
MIPKIIERALTHQDPFPLFGQDDTRSFCYVEDAVEAMQAAIESKNTDGGTYNIGASKETSIKEICEIIFNVINWHPEKFDLKASPEGSVTRCLPDVSKIKNDAGWETKFDMKQGLAKMIEWYKVHPNQAK